MKIQYHAQFSINSYLKDLLEQHLSKLDWLNQVFSSADAYFKLKEGSHTIEDKEIEAQLRKIKRISARF